MRETVVLELDRGEAMETAVASAILAWRVLDGRLHASLMAKVAISQMVLSAEAICELMAEVHSVQHSPWPRSGITTSLSSPKISLHLHRSHPASSQVRSERRRGETVDAAVSAVLARRQQEEVCKRMTRALDEALESQLRLDGGQRVSALVRHAMSLARPSAPNQGRDSARAELLEATHPDAKAVLYETLRTWVSHAMRVGKHSSADLGKRVHIPALTPHPRTSTCTGRPAARSLSA